MTARTAPRISATAEAPGRLEALQSGLQLRAGSLIVTILGDAILPRGGQVSLQTLTALLAAFAVNPGQARTALSRLVADGWLQRSRNGRQALYELAAARTRDFDRAMALVYDGPTAAWDGTFSQVVLVRGDATARTAQRGELERMGYAALAPQVWLRPNTLGRAREEPPAAPGLLHGVWQPLAGSDVRALAASVWPLETAAEAYRSFVRQFTPLADDVADEPSLAFRARILAVHTFRRAVLKDPGLPADLLPADWPGIEARRICANLYTRTLPASECWLESLAGPVTAPRMLAARFADLLQN